MVSLKCHLRGANRHEVWPVHECLHGRFPSKIPGVSHSVGLTTPFESTVNHCHRISKTTSSRITPSPTGDCRVKGFLSTPTNVVCFPEVLGVLAKVRSYSVRSTQMHGKRLPMLASILSKQAEELEEDSSKRKSQQRDLELE